MIGLMRVGLLPFGNIPHLVHGAKSIPGLVNPGETCMMMMQRRFGL
jgi:hypothetical protein